MKFKLIIPALLALLVVGCTRNMDLPEPAEQEGEIVTIRATIPRRPALHIRTLTSQAAVAPRMADG